MVTVRPRIRTGRDGRPATTAVAANAAITDARSTDGSKRVSSANQPIRASVAAQRVGARARRRTGDATASRSATFSPDTALKWARPEARNASTVAGGWPRSSPMTKPRYRLRSTGSMVREPRSSSRRTRLAEWASVVPSPTSSSRVGSRTATMWRLRNQPATDPLGGTTRPSTASCSPASRGRRRRAVPPKARSSMWRRPATTSATTPAPSGLGSVRRVTTPVNGPAPQGRRTRPRVRGQGAGQDEAAGDERRSPAPQDGDEHHRAGDDQATRPGCGERQPRPCGRGQGRRGDRSIAQPTGR